MEPDVPPQPPVENEAARYAMMLNQAGESLDLGPPIKKDSKGFKLASEESAEDVYAYYEGNPGRGIDLSGDLTQAKEHWEKIVQGYNTRHNDWMELIGESANMIAEIPKNLIEGVAEEGIKGIPRVLGGTLEGTVRGLHDLVGMIHTSDDPGSAVFWMRGALKSLWNGKVGSNWVEDARQWNEARRFHLHSMKMHQGDMSILEHYFDMDESTATKIRSFSNPKVANAMAFIGMEIPALLTAPYTGGSSLTGATAALTSAGAGAARRAAQVSGLGKLGAAWAGATKRFENFASKVTTEIAGRAALGTSVAMEAAANVVGGTVTKGLNVAADMTGRTRSAVANAAATAAVDASRILGAEQGVAQTVGFMNSLGLGATSEFLREFGETALLRSKGVVPINGATGLTLLEQVARSKNLSPAAINIAKFANFTVGHFHQLSTAALKRAYKDGLIFAGLGYANNRERGAVSGGAMGMVFGGLSGGIRYAWSLTNGGMSAIHTIENFDKQFLPIIERDNSSAAAVIRELNANIDSYKNEQASARQRLAFQAGLLALKNNGLLKEARIYTVSDLDAVFKSLDADQIRYDKARISAIAFGRGGFVGLRHAVTKAEVPVLFLPKERYRGIEIGHEIFGHVMKYVTDRNGTTSTHLRAYLGTSKDNGAAGTDELKATLASMKRAAEQAMAEFNGQSATIEQINARVREIVDGPESERYSKKYFMRMFEEARKEMKLNPHFFDLKDVGPAMEQVRADVGWAFEEHNAFLGEQAMAYRDLGDYVLPDELKPFRYDIERKLARSRSREIEELIVAGVRMVDKGLLDPKGDWRFNVEIYDDGVWYTSDSSDAYFRNIIKDALRFDDPHIRDMSPGEALAEARHYAKEELFNLIGSGAALKGTRELNEIFTERAKAALDALEAMDPAVRPEITLDEVGNRTVDLLKISDEGLEVLRQSLAMDAETLRTVMEVREGYRLWEQTGFATGNIYEGVYWGDSKRTVKRGMFQRLLGQDVPTTHRYFVPYELKLSHRTSGPDGNALREPRGGVLMTVVDFKAIHRRKMKMWSRPDVKAMFVTLERYNEFFDRYLINLMKDPSQRVTTVDLLRPDFGDKSAQARDMLFETFGARKKNDEAYINVPREGYVSDPENPDYPIHSMRVEMLVGASRFANATPFPYHHLRSYEPLRLNLSVSGFERVYMSDGRWMNGQGYEIMKTGTKWKVFSPFAGVVGVASDFQKAVKLVNRDMKRQDVADIMPMPTDEEWSSMTKTQRLQTINEVSRRTVLKRNTPDFDRAVIEGDVKLSAGRYSEGFGPMTVKIKNNLTLDKLYAGQMAVKEITVDGVRMRVTNQLGVRDILHEDAVREIDILMKKEMPEFGKIGDQGVFIINDAQIPSTLEFHPAHTYGKPSKDLAGFWTLNVASLDLGTMRESLAQHFSSGIGKLLSHYRDRGTPFMGGVINFWKNIAMNTSSDLAIMPYSFLSPKAINVLTNGGKFDDAKLNANETLAVQKQQAYRYTALRTSLPLGNMSVPDFFNAFPSSDALVKHLMSQHKQGGAPKQSRVATLFGLSTPIGIRGKFQKDPQYKPFRDAAYAYAKATAMYNHKLITEVDGHRFFPLELFGGKDPAVLEIGDFSDVAKTFNDLMREVDALPESERTAWFYGEEPKKNVGLQSFGGTLNHFIVQEIARNQRISETFYTDLVKVPSRGRQHSPKRGGAKGMPAGESYLVPPRFAIDNLAQTSWFVTVERPLTGTGNAEVFIYNPSGWAASPAYREGKITVRPSSENYRSSPGNGTGINMTNVGPSSFNKTWSHWAQGRLREKASDYASSAIHVEQAIGLALAAVPEASEAVKAVAAKFGQTKDRAAALKELQVALSSVNGKFLIKEAIQNAVFLESMIDSKSFAEAVTRRTGKTSSDYAPGVFDKLHLAGLHAYHSELLGAFDMVSMTSESAKEGMLKTLYESVETSTYAESVRAELERSWKGFGKISAKIAEPGSDSVKLSVGDISLLSNEKLNELKAAGLIRTYKVNGIERTTFEISDRNSALDYSKVGDKPHLLPFLNLETTPEQAYGDYAAQLSRQISVNDLSKTIMIPEPKDPVRLGEIWNHPELYEILPEIKDIPVAFYDGYGAYMVKGTPRLGLGVRNFVSHKLLAPGAYGDARMMHDQPDFGFINEFILHEVQHFIDDKTGLTSSDNLKRVSTSTALNYLANSLGIRDSWLPRNFISEAEVDRYSSTGEMAPWVDDVSKYNTFSDVVDAIRSGPDSPVIHDIRKGAAHLVGSAARSFASAFHKVEELGMSTGDLKQRASRIIIDAQVATTIEDLYKVNKQMEDLTRDAFVTNPMLTPLLSQDVNYRMAVQAVGMAKSFDLIRDKNYAMTPDAKGMAIFDLVDRLSRFDYVFQSAENLAFETTARRKMSAKELASQPRMNLADVAANRSVLDIVRGAVAKNLHGGVELKRAAGGKDFMPVMLSIAGIGKTEYDNPVLANLGKMVAVRYVAKAANDEIRAIKRYMVDQDGWTQDENGNLVLRSYKYVFRGDPEKFKPMEPSEGDTRFYTIKDIAELSEAAIESEAGISFSNTVMDLVSSPAFPEMVLGSEIRAELNKLGPHTELAAALVNLEGIESLPDQIYTKNDLLNIMSLFHSEASIGMASSLAADARPMLRAVELYEKLNASSLYKVAFGGANRALLMGEVAPVSRIKKIFQLSRQDYQWSYFTFSKNKVNFMFDDAELQAHFPLAYDEIQALKKRMVEGPMYQRVMKMTTNEEIERFAVSYAKHMLRTGPILKAIVQKYVAEKNTKVFDALYEIQEESIKASFGITAFYRPEGESSAYSALAKHGLYLPEAGKSGYGASPSESGITNQSREFLRLDDEGRGFITRGDYAQLALLKGTRASKGSEIVAGIPGEVKPAFGPQIGRPWEQQMATVDVAMAQPGFKIATLIEDPKFTFDNFGSVDAGKALVSIISTHHENAAAKVRNIEGLISFFKKEGDWANLEGRPGELPASSLVYAKLLPEDIRAKFQSGVPLNPEEINVAVQVLRERSQEAANSIPTYSKLVGMLNNREKTVDAIRALVQAANEKVKPERESTSAKVTGGAPTLQNQPFIGTNAQIAGVAIERQIQTASSGGGNVFVTYFNADKIGKTVFDVHALSGNEGMGVPKEFLEPIHDPRPGTQALVNAAVFAFTSPNWFKSTDFASDEFAAKFMAMPPREKAHFSGPVELAEAFVDSAKAFAEAPEMAEINLPYNTASNPALSGLEQRLAAWFFGNTAKLGDEPITANPRAIQEYNNIHTDAWENGLTIPGIHEKGTVSTLTIGMSAAPHLFNHLNAVGYVAVKDEGGVFGRIPGASQDVALANSALQAAVRSVAKGEAPVKSAIDAATTLISSLTKQDKIELAKDLAMENSSMAIATLSGLISNTALVRAHDAGQINFGRRSLRLDLNMAAVSGLEMNIILTENQRAKKKSGFITTRNEYNAFVNKLAESMDNPAFWVGYAIAVETMGKVKSEQVARYRWTHNSANLFNAKNHFTSFNRTRVTEQSWRESLGEDGSSPELPRVISLFPAAETNFQIIDSPGAPELNTELLRGTWERFNSSIPVSSRQDGGSTRLMTKLAGAILDTEKSLGRDMEYDVFDATLSEAIQEIGIAFKNRLTERGFVKDDAFGAGFGADPAMPTGEYDIMPGHPAHHALIGSTDGSPTKKIIKFVNPTEEARAALIKNAVSIAAKEMKIPEGGQIAIQSGRHLVSPRLNRIDASGIVRAGDTVETRFGNLRISMHGTFATYGATLGTRLGGEIQRPGFAWSRADDGSILVNFAPNADGTLPVDLAFSVPNKASIEFGLPFRRSIGWDTMSGKRIGGTYAWSSFANFMGADESMAYLKSLIGHNEHTFKGFVEAAVAGLAPRLSRNVSGLFDMGALNQRAMQVHNVRSHPVELKQAQSDAFAEIMTLVGDEARLQDYSKKLYGKLQQNDNSTATRAKVTMLSRLAHITAYDRNYATFRLPDGATSSDLLAAIATVTAALAYRHENTPAMGEFFGAPDAVPINNRYKAASGIATETLRSMSEHLIMAYGFSSSYGEAFINQHAPSKAAEPFRATKARLDIESIRRALRGETYQSKGNAFLAVNGEVNRILGSSPELGDIVQSAMDRISSSEKGYYLPEHERQLSIYGDKKAVISAMFPGRSDLERFAWDRSGADATVVRRSDGSYIVGFNEGMPDGTTRRLVKAFGNESSANEFARVVSASGIMAEAAKVLGREGMKIRNLDSRVSRKTDINKGLSPSSIESTYVLSMENGSVQVAESSNFTVGGMDMPMKRAEAEALAAVMDDQSVLMVNVPKQETVRLSVSGFKDAYEPDFSKAASVGELEALLKARINAFPGSPYQFGSRAMTALSRGGVPSKANKKVLDMKEVMTGLEFFDLFQHNGVSKQEMKSTGLAHFLYANKDIKMTRLEVAKFVTASYPKVGARRVSSAKSALDFNPGTGSPGRPVVFGMPQHFLAPAVAYDSQAMNFRALEESIAAQESGILKMDGLTPEEKDAKVLALNTVREAVFNELQRSMEEVSGKEVVQKVFELIPGFSSLSPLHKVQALFSKRGLSAYRDSFGSDIAYVDSILTYPLLENFNRRLFESSTNGELSVMMVNAGLDPAPFISDGVLGKLEHKDLETVIGGANSMLKKLYQNRGMFDDRGTSYGGYASAVGPYDFMAMFHEVSQDVERMNRFKEDIYAKIREAGENMQPEEKARLSRMANAIEYVLEVREKANSKTSTSFGHTGGPDGSGLVGHIRTTATGLSMSWPSGLTAEQVRLYVDNQLAKGMKAEPIDFVEEIQSDIYQKNKFLPIFEAGVLPGSLKEAEAFAALPEAKRLIEQIAAAETGASGYTSRVNSLLSSRRHISRNWTGIRSSAVRQMLKTFGPMEIYQLRSRIVARGAANEFSSMGSESQLAEIFQDTGRRIRLTGEVAERTGMKEVPVYEMKAERVPVSLAVELISEAAGSLDEVVQEMYSKQIEAMAGPFSEATGGDITSLSNLARSLPGLMQEQGQGVITQLISRLSHLTALYVLSDPRVAAIIKSGEIERAPMRENQTSQTEFAPIVDETIRSVEDDAFKAVRSMIVNTPVGTDFTVAQKMLLVRMLEVSRNVDPGYYYARLSKTDVFHGTDKAIRTVSVNEEIGIGHGYGHIWPEAIRHDEPIDGDGAAKMYREMISSAKWRLNLEPNEKKYRVLRPVIAETQGGYSFYAGMLNANTNLDQVRAASRLSQRLVDNGHATQEGVGANETGIDYRTMTDREAANAYLDVNMGHIQDILSDSAYAKAMTHMYELGAFGADGRGPLSGENYKIRTDLMPFLTKKFTLELPGSDLRYITGKNGPEYIPVANSYVIPPEVARNPRRLMIAQMAWNARNALNYFNMGKRNNEALIATNLLKETFTTMLGLDTPEGLTKAVLEIEAWLDGKPVELSENSAYILDSIPFHAKDPVTARMMPYNFTALDSDLDALYSLPSSLSEPVNIRMNARNVKTPAGVLAYDYVKVADSGRKMAENIRNLNKSKARLQEIAKATGLDLLSTEDALPDSLPFGFEDAYKPLSVDFAVMRTLSAGKRSFGLADARHHQTRYGAGSSRFYVRVGPLVFRGLSYQTGYGELAALSTIAHDKGTHGGFLAALSDGTIWSSLKGRGLGHHFLFESMSWNGKEGDLAFHISESLIEAVNDIPDGFTGGKGIFKYSTPNHRANQIRAWTESVINPCKEEMKKRSEGVGSQIVDLDNPNDKHLHLVERAQQIKKSRGPFIAHLTDRAHGYASNYGMPMWAAELMYPGMPKDYVNGFALDAFERPSVVRDEATGTYSLLNKEGKNVVKGIPTEEMAQEQAQIHSKYLGKVAHVTNFLKKYGPNGAYVSEGSAILGGFGVGGKAFTEQASAARLVNKIGEHLSPRLSTADDVAAQRISGGVTKPEDMAPIERIEAAQNPRRFNVTPGTDSSLAEVNKSDFASPMEAAPDSSIMARGHLPEALVAYYMGMTTYDPLAARIVAARSLGAYTPVFNVFPRHGMLPNQKAAYLKAVRDGVPLLSLDGLKNEVAVRKAIEASKLPDTYNTSLGQARQDIEDSLR